MEECLYVELKLEFDGGGSLWMRHARISLRELNSLKVHVMCGK